MDEIQFRAWCEGGGSCVEVAIVTDLIIVRDSKDPDGPVLVFTKTEWSEFIQGAKAGMFDIG